MYIHFIHLYNINKVENDPLQADSNTDLNDIYSKNGILKKYYKENTTWLLQLSIFNKINIGFIYLCNYTKMQTFMCQKYTGTNFGNYLFSNCKNY